LKTKSDVPFHFCRQRIYAHRKGAICLKNEERRRESLVVGSDELEDIKERLERLDKRLTKVEEWIAEFGTEE